MLCGIGASSRLETSTGPAVGASGVGRPDDGGAIGSRQTGAPPPSGRPLARRFTWSTKARRAGGIRRRSV